MRLIFKLFILLSLQNFVGQDQVWANYVQGQTLLQKGDYSNAANAFFQSYTSAKSPQEKIWSEWGLGQSLQKMGFLYSASKYYSIIVRRGPSASNPYFKKAFEELGVINSTVSLGQSHVVQLFKTKIDAASVPGPSRGFYFFYLGVEAFLEKKFEVAGNYFRKVPANTAYYTKALFHLGVIANLSGSHSRALKYFENVQSNLKNSDSESRWIEESTSMNIARVYYETKRYTDALKYYSQVPRDSDNWLEAIFESGWAFFLMQKHNNTLGNIHTLHSPFFENRFYPETYILQAITFLRLCRYEEVKKSLMIFKTRYKSAFQDMRTMLGQYGGDAKGFFKVVYDYRVGSLNKYRSVWEILDALSRTDFYREAGNTIRFSDNEIARLSNEKSRWSGSGLADDLTQFLQKKKQISIQDSGSRLLEKAKGYYAYLKELSDQTQLINAELVLGRVDAFRKQLNVGTADPRVQFIGGMQPLEVGAELEYWPFQGEYWEDELGGYVYNINSKCQAGAAGAEKKEDKPPATDVKANPKK